MEKPFLQRKNKQDKNQNFFFLSNLFPLKNLYFFVKLLFVSSFILWKYTLMVEKAKKTTASENQKWKKILVRKPKATEETTQRIVKQKNSTSVKVPSKLSCKENCACHKKDYFRILVIWLLVINLIVEIWMAVKITHLQNWITMWSGGEANLHRLEAIYATPEYQEHFKNEIDTLENQIKIMNPKAE